MSAPTWADITKWAADEIETARTELELPGDPTSLRARIAVLRELIAQGSPKPKPEMPESVPYT